MTVAVASSSHGERRAFKKQNIGTTSYKNALLRDPETSSIRLKAMRITQDSANEVTAWVMLNLFQHLAPEVNYLKSNSCTGCHYKLVEP